MVIIILLFSLLLTLNQSFGLHPVLLVPGDGGSQLSAQYIKSPPHYLCGRQNKWFQLWLNIYFMLPITLDCFVKTIQLEYDVKSHKTYAPEFCNVQAFGFGSVDTIAYLSDLKLKKTSYFYYLIKDLVTTLGYIPGINLRGAPYDFRKSPNEMNQFITDLRRLVELMYNENGNKSVILIGHSLGTLYLNLLLNSMTKEWKNVYVSMFFSVSGPYLGAVEALRTALSGNNENIPIIAPIKIRPAQSSWPSTYFLMPSEKLYPNQTMVATNEGYFTSYNIAKLLKYSNIKNAVHHYQDTAPTQNKLGPPQVLMYCIYGYNIPTPKILDYVNLNFPDSQPKIVYGVGDGTVNLESLTQCTKWKDFQKEPVVTYRVPDVTHLNIVRDERLVKYIVNVIKGINK